MHISKKIPVLLLLGFVVLLVSSCGINGTTGNGGNTSSAPLTLAQLLQKTTTTMKQLKSVSYNLDSASSTTLPSFTGSSTPQKLAITTKGNGVSVQPSDAKVQLSLNSAGQDIAINEIVKGQKLYIQNKKGQWYVLDKAKAQGSAVGSPDLTGYNSLLALSNVKIIDDGTTTLDGTSVRHATITFNKNALNDLLNATGTLNSLPASQKQDMTKLLQNMTLKNTVLDVWIDPATTYIHRFKLQFDLEMDMSKLITPTPGASSSPLIIDSAQNVTIDYSKFNVPVTITAPNNAIPTSDILTALA